MVARVVWDHEAAGSSPVTSTIGMRRRFIEICGASVIRYTCMKVLRQRALPRFIFLLSFPCKKAIIISNFA